MKAEAITPGSKIDWGGITAWCLGKMPNGYLPDRVLIGWKPDEHISRGWPLHELDELDAQPARIMLKTAGCDRGWWLLAITDVALINEARVANKSPGMSCRLCHDFSPMAEANRPDGVSFICYSCRCGWIPENM